MPVETGTRLGVYQIVGPLGAGAMGEVYRARDPRLGREVAIKILPPAFSTDAARLARFEQEARAAAGLNHPNILAVFDVGQLGDSPYIVSELLDGSTLRDLLGGTGLPIRKAIEYGTQIAKGLTAAHDKGIVHRDLKPENLFITTDGRVKILDFGLAKLTEKASPDDGVSDVATKANTDPGLVLGTVGYMAPEQVRGLQTDHRSDIFAFGCVLYEMLSGHRAFRRETSMDTMSAILTDDPADLPLVERHIPPALARIVDRCLEKVPGARFQSTGDLAFALEGLSSQTEGVPATIAHGAEPRRKDRLAWTLVSVLAVVALVLAVAAALLLWRAPPSIETTRFFVSPPEGWNLAAQIQGGPTVGPLAISPDGRQVAFVARNASAQSLIWVRSLNALDAKGLAGTEGGSSPFWSPDSRSLGFFSDGKLKTIEISGGPPVVLCDTAPGISGTWSPIGVIVFSPAAGTPLFKVSATGGVPTPATLLEAGEGAHTRPTFLPDGRHFVFGQVQPTATRNAAIVGSLDSMERTRLMDTDSTNVLYSQGHLLFLRETTLMAQAFDADRLATRGDPFPVAERIQTFGGPPLGFFSVSDSGVLAYQSGTATNEPQLTWVDRTGRTLGTVGEPASYADMVLSRDGSKAAVSRASDGQPGSDVWVVDLNREGLPSRLTFDEGLDITPVWSPDGSRIAFSSSVVSGNFNLYVKSASGAGAPQLLVSGNGTQVPLDWSDDGRFLLYASNDPGPGFDLWILPMTGGAKPFPFLRAPGNQGQGEFSPDGRWIAYRSVESGLTNVYVAPFDGLHAATGEKYQISTGGSIPRWRADGKEIFFVSQPTRTLMSAGVSSTASTFQADAVRPLFPFRPAGNQRFNYEYAPSPDGQRFLVNMGPSGDAPPTPITVVLNWLAGVRR